MCAPDHTTMANSSVHRYSYQSSGQNTLVGSDNGLVSPIDAYPSKHDGVTGQSPIVQTVDSKPWVRLDSLHPKLLKELYGGYDVPEINQKHTRAKGGSRVKAWVRQRSNGFALRFRRKISDDHDEVIDAEFVTEPRPDMKPPPSGMIELPENLLFEMEGIGIVPEAPSDAVVREDELGLSRRGSAGSRFSWTADPVPQYEPSLSNMIVAPVRSLELEYEKLRDPVELPAAGPDHGAAEQAEASVQQLSSASAVDQSAQDSTHPSKDLDQPVQKEPVSESSLEAIAHVKAQLDKTRQQLEQAEQAKEDIASQMTLLKQKLSEQDEAKNSNPLGGFKIVGRKRYETETDVEPPSPSDTAEVRPLRLNTSVVSLPRRKGATHPKITRERATSSSSDDDTSDHMDGDGGFSSRLRAGPCRTPANAGRESVLTALLRAQAEILGPAHPLTSKARRKRPRNVKDWEGQRITELLGLLRRGEKLAKSTMGEKHPRVETFCSDLRTFEGFVARFKLASVDELISQLEEQVASGTPSPTSPTAKSGDDEAGGKSDTMPVNGDDAGGNDALSKANEAKPDALLTTKQTLVNGNKASGDKSCSEANEPKHNALLPIDQTHVNGNNASGDIACSEAIEAKPVVFTLTKPAQPESPSCPSAVTYEVSPGGSGFISMPIQSYQPRPPIAVLTGLAIAAATKGLMGFLDWVQRNYGPEPAIEPGKTRVRWTCPCGERLYDDYIEVRPGAARQLEAFLNRPRPQTRSSSSSNISHNHTHAHTATASSAPTTPISPSSSNDTGSFAGSSIGGAPSANPSWSSQSSLSLGGSDLKSSRGAGAGGATLASLYPSSFSPRPDPPYLLICASEDGFTTRMTHLDAARDHMTSDMRLGRALREHYAHVNRHWTRALRLRALARIEFVQFEVHSHRLADIRKSPDVPAGAARGDYEFVAVVDEAAVGGGGGHASPLLPPLGSKLLVHLFRHPEDFDRELMAYMRMPKRTAGRLEIGVGWGLHLVDDFLKERVQVLINVLVAFASLVFVIAWACARHDVQGAFSVAQWICMGAVFVAGWVQLYVG